MTKIILAFFPLAITFALLTSFQMVFAQLEVDPIFNPIVCFFFPEDPRCIEDTDNDGLKDDVDPYIEDPCLPNRFVSACEDWDEDGVKNTFDQDNRDPCQPNPYNQACNTASKIIASFVKEEYKHLYISPPSKIYPPGTIVFVGDNTNDPSKTLLEVVCKNEEVLGKDFKLIESPTLDASHGTTLLIPAYLRREVEDLMKEEFGNKFKNINSIVLYLKNAHIVTLSDTDINTMIRDNLTEECKTAIELRQARKHKVTMIRSVVQATLTYSLDLELDTNETDVQLLTNIDEIVSSAISKHGKDIYWGVSLMPLDDLEF